MRIPKIAICVLVVCGGASTIAGQRIATPARTQSQGPRPIVSLSFLERTQLPANTQVKLPSGEVVTLGVLRAQHEAHTHALAAAAGLGRTMAEKLRQQSPVSGQAAGNLSSSPVTNGPSRAGTARRAAVDPLPPPPHPVSALQVPKMSMVPMARAPSDRAIAKDYVDFCNAAQSTVCLYLPADTDLRNHLGQYLEARDYLLSSEVCQYDGGYFTDGVGCFFEYPGYERENFLPTGPATVTDSCTSSTYTYKLDPKGAVAAQLASYKAFRTPPGQPQTCVLRVWLSKSN